MTTFFLSIVPVLPILILVIGVLFASPDVKPTKVDEALQREMWADYFRLDGLEVPPYPSDEIDDLDDEWDFDAIFAELHR